MHKDDQMTPKERAFALFAGKPVDRMPIKLFSPYIGMNFGASYQDAFVEAKSRAHWLIESYKRFGQDGLSVNYRIDGIPVAFGAESTYDPLGIPMIKENILKDFSEIDQLDLEKIRFENDPNAQTAFEAVQIIQDIISFGCSMPISSIRVGMMSARRPPSRSLYCGSAFTRMNGT